MPYGASVECTCAECSSTFQHAKKLSIHLKSVHGMTSLEYVVKHRHGGTRPTCLNCGSETRFISLIEGFKRYCPGCRRVAESLAGKRGGTTKRTWSKGLTKETDIRLAQRSERMMGSSNHFFGRKHTDDSNRKNADAQRLGFETVIERFRSAVPTVDVLSGSDEYADQTTPLNVRCTVCGTCSSVSLFNVQRAWRCRTCFPTASRPQLEIVEFVRSLGVEDVIVSTKNVIAPFELDVWVPEFNVAIEYHGLYWHSGGKSGVFDRKRHRQKYVACSGRSIKLVQFFSDEWIDRGAICTSMIRNALGLNTVLLNARDCSIVDLDHRTSSAFVDANHISGSTRARHHVGLVHPAHGLVGVATVRTPIQKKWGHVCELARMCFSRNTTVRGGASKLLSRVKSIAVADGFDGVLSYAELRFGDGKVYERCGFELVGEALNNYWYTDGRQRFNRFKYRAQPGKTEKQVADENGVRPVYGCGNRIYLHRFDKDPTVG